MTTYVEKQVTCGREKHDYHVGKKWHGNLAHFPPNGSSLINIRWKIKECSNPQYTQRVVKEIRRYKDMKYWETPPRTVMRFHPYDLHCAKRSLTNVLSRCHTNVLNLLFMIFLKKKKFFKIFEFFFFFLSFFFFFFREQSVSYQKKGGRGPARPSFFWYDNDSGH